VRKNTISAFDEFEGTLFGIVTQLKDYRLCWHINASLAMDLKKMNDIEIVSRKKNRTAVFSLCRYENELDKWLVYLVSNRHQGEYLLPELKLTDFLFIINGEMDAATKDQILSALKNIPAIQMVVPLLFESLKSKRNLIFE
jgi:hypothetical protein